MFWGHTRTYANGEVLTIYARFHLVKKFFHPQHPFEQNAIMFDSQPFFERFAILHCYYKIIGPLLGHRKKENV